MKHLFIGLLVALSLAACGEGEKRKYKAKPTPDARVEEPTEFPNIFEKIVLVPQSDGGLFLEDDAKEGFTMIVNTYDQYVFIWGGTPEELAAYEARTDAREIAELEGNRQNYDTDPDSPWICRY